MRGIFILLPHTLASTKTVVRIARQTKGELISIYMYMYILIIDPPEKSTCIKLFLLDYKPQHPLGSR
jgi:hypothetical protein